MGTDRIEERLRESLSHVSLPDGADPVAAEVVGEVREKQVLDDLYALDPGDRLAVRTDDPEGIIDATDDLLAESSTDRREANHLVTLTRA